MRWEVTAAGTLDAVVIKYDLEWLYSVMILSANSMVKYQLFSHTFRETNRLYPRSSDAAFILGRTGEPESKPSAGGRELVGYGVCAELCELLATTDGELPPIPLGDIAIMSKRAVCDQVRTLVGTSHRNFTVQRDLRPGDPGDPGWPVHGYPMLCIIGRSGSFPSDQAQWRVVQCVFAAALTSEIRAKGIGIEVVSREGFGSVFPTVADLPDGIRLDPGLLPTTNRAGEQPAAVAIANALRVADNFITAMQGVKLPRQIANLGGFTKESLAAVDRLMSKMHQLTTDRKGRPGAERLAALVADHNGAGVNYVLPRIGLGGGVEYQVAAVLPDRVHVPTDRDSQDWDGYGSDSEGEEEYDDDEEGRAFAIKKVSVVSGMAALRMATSYAMLFSKMIVMGGEGPTDPILQTWAPYFELDHEELFLAKAGVRVLVTDGAPNPINIPTTGFILSPNLGAIVIDTTNNTSEEMSAYVSHFKQHLAPGGLLLMIDSASKHPTGGDLVHGIMRVCGPRDSVNTFFKGLLRPHLKFGQYVGEAEALTVLSPGETQARRLMIDLRLVRRNQDIAPRRE